MNGRKVLSLALASIAVLTLAFGSGAFTSVSAERGVSVSVVGDDAAYVGYESSDVTARSDGEVTLITVQNRFANQLWIESVAVGENDIISEDEIDYPTDSNMTSGDTQHITWSGDCDGLANESVAVDVTVSGTGVAAWLDGDTETRRFNVKCAPPSAVRFNGQGTVLAEADQETDLAIDYWTTNASAKEDDVEINGSFDAEITPGKNENIVQGQESVVAIYLPKYGVTYVRPGYDVDDGTTDDWGSGTDSPTVYDGIPSGL